MKVSTWLGIFDAHHPYCDRRAYDLALNVALQGKYNLKGILLGGDFGDHYGISRYKKDPTNIFSWKEECFAISEELKALKKIQTDIEIVYIGGNHEHRLYNFLIDNAPQMLDGTTYEEIFHLKELGIQYITYGPEQEFWVPDTNVMVRHEPLAGGKFPSLASISEANASVIFGHHHRRQFAAKNIIKDKTIREGHSVGWLGDREKYPQVFGYLKTANQWQHGFCLIHVFPDGSHFIDNILIKNYKVIHGNQYYEG